MSTSNLNNNHGSSGGLTNNSGEEESHRIPSSTSEMSLQRRKRDLLEVSDNDEDVNVDKQKKKIKLLTTAEMASSSCRSSGNYSSLFPTPEEIRRSAAPNVLHSASSSKAPAQVTQLKDKNSAPATVKHSSFVSSPPPPPPPLPAPPCLAHSLPTPGFTKGNTTRDSANSMAMAKAFSSSTTTQEPIFMVDPVSNHHSLPSSPHGNRNHSIKPTTCDDNTSNHPNKSPQTKSTCALKKVAVTKPTSQEQPPMIGSVLGSLVRGLGWMVGAAVGGILLGWMAVVVMKKYHLSVDHQQMSQQPPPTVQQILPLVLPDDSTIHEGPKKRERGGENTQQDPLSMMQGNSLISNIPIEHSNECASNPSLHPFEPLIIMESLEEAVHDDDGKSSNVMVVEHVLQDTPPVTMDGGHSIEFENREAPKQQLVRDRTDSGKELAGMVTAQTKETQSGKQQDDQQIANLPMALESLSSREFHHDDENSIVEEEKSTLSSFKKSEILETIKRKSSGVNSNESPSLLASSLRFSNASVASLSPMVPPMTTERNASLKNIQNQHLSNNNELVLDTKKDSNDTTLDTPVAPLDVETTEQRQDSMGDDLTKRDEIGEHTKGAVDVVENPLAMGNASDPPTKDIDVDVRDLDTRSEEPETVNVKATGREVASSTTESSDKPSIQALDSLLPAKSPTSSSEKAMQPLGQERVPKESDKASRASQANPMGDAEEPHVQKLPEEPQELQATFSQLASDSAREETNEESRTVPKGEEELPRETTIDIESRNSEDNEESKPMPAPPNKYDVRLLLELLPSFTTEAIENDENSPQAMALKWCEEDQELAHISDSRKLQRFALVTLCFALSSGSSLVPRPAEHECQWFRRSLEDNRWFCNESDEIVHLAWYDLSLSGTMEPEIQLLSSLQFLDLRENPGIAGQLPSTIGLLSNLEHLLLQGCNFESPIPTELWTLPRLESLGLSDNHKIFNGSTLPTVIMGLSSLRDLQLVNVGLNGPIDSTIGELKELERIFLAENQLTHIPDEIAKLRKLQVLDLSKNQLAEIPTIMSRLRKLEVLKLNGNHELIMKGTIPRQLSSLKKLRTLHLQHEDGSGIQIPNADEIQASLPELVDFQY